jgi:putative transposase
LRNHADISPTEIAKARHQQGWTVAQVSKRHGISAQAIYTWRKQYGAMDANEVKRLRMLEQENARLKKMLAERDLEIDVMKEIAAKKW